MAKVRVHELAKELGITSKDAVTKLQELGEFVRSASSTIEAPVVRKLRNAFPDAAAASKSEAPASAPKAPASPAANRPAPAPAPAAPKAAEPKIEAPAPASAARGHLVCLVLPHRTSTPGKGRQTWAPGPERRGRDSNPRESLRPLLA